MKEVTNTNSIGVIFMPRPFSCREDAGHYKLPVSSRRCRTIYGLSGDSFPDVWRIRCLRVTNAMRKRMQASIL